MLGTVRKIRFKFQNKISNIELLVEAVSWLRCPPPPPEGGVDQTQAWMPTYVSILRIPQII
jgi:hypothetical protein